MKKSYCQPLVSCKDYLLNIEVMLLGSNTSSELDPTVSAPQRGEGATVKLTKMYI